MLGYKTAPTNLKNVRMHSEHTGAHRSTPGAHQVMVVFPQMTHFVKNKMKMVLRSGIWRISVLRGAQGTLWISRSPCAIWRIGARYLPSLEVAPSATMCSDKREQERYLEDSRITIFENMAPWPENCIAILHILLVSR